MDSIGKDCTIFHGTARSVTKHEEKTIPPISNYSTIIEGKEVNCLITQLIDYRGDVPCFMEWHESNTMYEQKNIPSVSNYRPGGE